MQGQTPEVGNAWSSQIVSVEFGPIDPDARLSDGRLVYEAMDERIAHPLPGDYEWLLNKHGHVYISDSRDADGNPIWHDLGEVVSVSHVVVREDEIA